MTRVRLPDWRREEAAQLVEFAMALPLLIVFVVGIFDFSSAFTLKQKLTNIARDTARAAAADPASDLGNPTAGATCSLPYSVCDAFYVFHNYLKANNINDCGLVVTSGAATGTLTWQFTVPATSSCSIKLTINRGYYFPLANPVAPPPLTCVPTPPGTLTQLIGTCVSVQYGYQWRFGQVASLLGKNNALPSTISTTAVALNED